jgi:ribose 5-phosphate isomerase B
MIYIGADHNGFWMKEELKSYLQRKKVAFRDMGALKYKKTDDYPDYANRVTGRIKDGDLGILLCGSGHGMSMAANKKRHIRAAHVVTIFSAKKSREDDHANVLVISSWELSVEKSKRILAAWLKAKPSNAARHIRRVKKINRIKP